MNSLSKVNDDPQQGPLPEDWNDHGPEPSSHRHCRRGYFQGDRGLSEPSRLRTGGGLFHDPVQTALIQFLRLPGDSILIELVAPDGPASRLSKVILKGGGINHLCHSTPDIEAACRSLQDQGMAIIEEPTPAVAFGGRRIAWLMGDDHVLTELVERPTPAD